MTPSFCTLGTEQTSKESVNIVRSSDDTDPNTKVNFSNNENPCPCILIKDPPVEDPMDGCTRERVKEYRLNQIT